MRNKLLNAQEIKSWANQKMNNFNDHLTQWGRQNHITIPKNLLRNNPIDLKNGLEQFSRDDAVRRFPDGYRTYSHWHDDWGQKLQFSALADMANNHPEMASYERDLAGNVVTPGNMLHLGGYYHVNDDSVPTKLVQRDAQQLGNLDTTQYAQFLENHPKFDRAIDVFPAQALRDYNDQHGFQDRNQSLTNRNEFYDGDSIRNYGTNGHKYHSASLLQARARYYVHHVQIERGQRFPRTLAQGYALALYSHSDPRYNYGNAIHQRPELADRLNVKGVGRTVYDKTNNNHLSFRQLLERNRQMMVNDSTKLLNRLRRQDQRHIDKRVVTSAEEIARSAGGNAVNNYSTRNWYQSRGTARQRNNSSRGSRSNSYYRARRKSPRAVYYVGSDNQVHRQIVRIPWGNLRQNINNVHNQFLANHPNARIMEVSSMSRNPIANQASAMNMDVTVGNRKYKVENLFQAGKYFGGNVGSMKGALNVQPKGAKAYVRRHYHGQKMQKFHLFGQDFPLKPRTLYYDWIYLHAVNSHPAIKEGLAKNNAFTDIFSNPYQTINSQAKSNALYKSIVNQYGMNGFNKAMGDFNLFRKMDAQVNNDDVSRRIQAQTKGHALVKPSANTSRQHAVKQSKPTQTKPKYDPKASKSLAVDASILGLSKDGKIATTSASLTSGQAYVAGVYMQARAGSQADLTKSSGSKYYHNASGFTSSARSSIASNAVDVATHQYSVANGSSFSDKAFAKGLNLYNDNVARPQSAKDKSVKLPNKNLGGYLDKNPALAKKLYVYSGHQVGLILNQRISQSRKLEKFMKPDEKKYVEQNNTKMAKFAKKLNPEKAYTNLNSGNVDMVKTINRDNVAKNISHLAQLHQTNHDLNNLHRMMTNSSSREYDMFIDRHPNLKKPLGLEEAKLGGRHYTKAEAKGQDRRVAPLQLDGADGNRDGLNRVESAMRRQKVAIYFATPSSFAGKTRDKPNLQTALESIQNPTNLDKLHESIGKGVPFVKKDMDKLRAGNDNKLQSNPKQDKHDANVIENFAKKTWDYSHHDVNTLSKLANQYEQRYKLLNMYSSHPDLAKSKDYSAHNKEQKQIINYNLALDKSDGYHFAPKINHQGQSPKVVEKNMDKIANESTLDTLHKSDVKHADDPKYTIDKKMKSVDKHDRNLVNKRDLKDLKSFKSKIHNKGFSPGKFLNKHSNLKTRLFLKTDKKGQVYSKNAEPKSAMPYNKANINMSINMTSASVAKAVKEEQTQEKSKDNKPKKKISIDFQAMKNSSDRAKSQQKKLKKKHDRDLGRKGTKIGKRTDKHREKSRAKARSTSHSKNPDWQ